MAIIAKYEFNQELYANLLPEFNGDFTNYTVTDVDAQGIVDFTNKLMQNTDTVFTVEVLKEDVQEERRRTSRVYDVQETRFSYPF